MLFKGTIKAYSTKRALGQLDRYEPEARKEIEKTLEKYDKWANVIHSCFSMLDTQSGDIRTLFVDGGLYDQPSIELSQLFAVQNAFKRYTQEHYEEMNKKNKHRK